MGTWGLQSDENDGVWDGLGLGIEHRMQGLAPLQLDHAAMMKQVNGDYPDKIPVGICIWLLKMGCGLKQDILRKCLADLQRELTGETPYGDKEDRRKVIRVEMVMVDAALANEDGYAPDESVKGVLGIGMAQFSLTNGKPWHTPVRRLEDGSLVLAE
jgi:hypothetical protein